GLERCYLPVQHNEMLEALTESLGRGFIEFDLRPCIGTQDLAHDPFHEAFNATAPASPANLDLLTKVWRLPAQAMIEPSQFQKSDIRRLEATEGGGVAHALACGQTKVPGQGIGLNDWMRD